MSSKRKPALEVAEPTPAAPTIPSPRFEVLTIDGKEYKLTFDINTLARAEAHFLGQGHRIPSLVFALDYSNPRISLMRVLFAAAAHHYQPELELKDAVELFTLPILLNFTAIVIGAVAGEETPKEQSEAGR